MQLSQKKQPREIVAHREQKVQEVNTREEENNKFSAQFNSAPLTPTQLNLTKSVQKQQLKNSKT